MYSRICLAALAALALSASTFAADEHPAAEQQVIELSKSAIALRSVRGEGNMTPQVAQLFKQALLSGGWAASDIEIVPMDDTAYLIATWAGSDPTLGPIVISAHMDVVEAKPEDWERDPFTPILENGYLYGRGSSDTKFDAVQAMVSVMELRRQGYKPKRSIVIAFSGDEETTMATSKVIAERLKEAKLVLNVDSYSGVLDENTGMPSYWSWQGAEKTYGDFQLVVTNPGGHSSTPRVENAIAQLSAALVRIAAYRFTPELNDITRDYFTKAANFESDPSRAAAMRAFARDPADEAAIAVLRADPTMIGKIGTTCVPTMVDGGHAVNALPQRATAIINCRIFPGHPKEEIMAELVRVAEQSEVQISEINPEYVVTAPASPYDREFIDAATRAVHTAFGDIPIIASQASGASDSMWYRALGVPAYGASGTFMKDSDDYAHGLNERVPLANIGASINYYLTLLKELTAT